MTVLQKRSIFIPASAKFSKGKQTYANPSRGISASCSQDQSKGKQKKPQTTKILPKKKKKPKQKLIKISRKYNNSRELQGSREGRLKVESPQFITRPSLAPQVAVGLLNDYIYNLKFPPT